MRCWAPGALPRVTGHTKQGYENDHRQALHDRVTPIYLLSTHCHFCRMFLPSGRYIVEFSGWLALVNGSEGNGPAAFTQRSPWLLMIVPYSRNWAMHHSIAVFITTFLKRMSLRFAEFPFYEVG